MKLVFVCLCLMVAVASATQLEMTREQAFELAEIESRIRLATNANERLEAEANRQTFLLGRENPTAQMAAAVTKLRSLSGPDQTYSKIQFVWRAFISKLMPGGFWLDAHCAPQKHKAAKIDHEYVGRSPRIANPLGNECFRTDSRGYSLTIPDRSRLNHQVDITPSKVNVVPAYSDETLFYVCESPSVLSSMRKKCGDVICRKRSPASAVHTENLNCFDGSKWVAGCGGVNNPDIVFFTLRGTPGDPCTPPGTPKIDYYGRIAIFPKKRFITVDGKTDDYPWLEVVAKIDGRPRTIVRVPPKGSSPFSLYGGASNPVVGSGTF